MVAGAATMFSTLPSTMHSRCLPLWKVTGKTHDSRSVDEVYHDQTFTHSTMFTMIEHALI